MPLNYVSVVECDCCGVSTDFEGVIPFVRVTIAQPGVAEDTTFWLCTEFDCGDGVTAIAHTLLTDALVAHGTDNAVMGHRVLHPLMDASLTRTNPPPSPPPSDPPPSDPPPSDPPPP